MSLDLTAAVHAKRQAARLFMSDSVIITDPGTVTTTSDGGTTVASGGSLSVAGRLVRAGTQSFLQTFGAQVSAEADYLLYLPHGTALSEGWTVNVGGITFTVIAVSKLGAWQVMVRAALVSSTPIGG